MKKILLFFFVSSLFLVSKAQYENTLYYLNRIPQANYLNPATNPDCKWWMGGLLVPFAGQMPFPMAFQFHTPLSVSDLAYPGSGFMSDSLVLPWNPTEKSIAGEKDFLDKLYEWNYITQEADLNLINVGFRIKRNFFTIELSEKQNSSYIFPADFIKFWTQGNGNVRNADIGSFGFNFNYYHQLALGYNREIIDGLKMGIKLKLLAGVANIQTEKSQLNVQTMDTTNEIRIKSNYIINTSLKIDTVEYDEYGIFSNVEPKEISVESSSDIIDLALLTGNYGGAIDFGFHYEINDQFSVHGSVLDLGMINWNDESSSFQISGDKEFNGIEIIGVSLDSLTHYAGMDDGLESAFDDLKENNTIVYKKKGYTTYLTPRAFLGGTYSFSKKLDFGLLARLDFYEKYIRQSYTASLNFHVFRYGEIGLSYAYINGSFANVGLAYTLRIGAWQMFFASDNLLVIPMIEKNDIILPYSAYSRNMGFRMGTNLVFGRGKKAKRPDKNQPLFNSL